MKLDESPSFFKVLAGDFSRQLRIPREFSRELERFGVGGNATLRLSSGVTWNVTVGKTEDGEREFAGGWGEFADDAGLKSGEFIVFWLVGKSLFDVAIYGASCCDREFPLMDDDSGDDDVTCKRRVPPEFHRSSPGSSSNPLYFEIIMKNHQKSRLALGKRFWEAAGLMGRKSVGLVYLPKHYYQSVTIEHNPRSYRLDLTAGWASFRKANGLDIGRAYSFEFKPKKNVIQVRKLQSNK